MHNTTSAFFPQQQQQRNEEKDAAPNAARQPTAASQISSQGPGLLCGAAHGSAIHSSSTSGGRGLRFPSSRRYLWDRTPAGPQILINTQDHVPHVQVAVSSFSAISRAAERQTAVVPLQLGISVTRMNQVTALVQELDPLVCKVNAGDTLQLTCPLLQNEVQQDAVVKLRSILQAQLDQCSSARVQQLYAVAATAVAAAAPGSKCCLQLQLLMPNCSFMVTPLYAKRLCHVPLAEALLKPGGMQTWQSGCLSMDQARSLLPLEPNDPNVYSTPLVGVWVKGPSSVMHPLVAMACLRFAYSSLLADRAVNAATGAFLLLLCPEGDPVSKCFEVCPSDLRCLQLGSYQYTAALNPKATMEQCPGGLVKAECRVSVRKAEPLPGSRLAALAAATSACGSSNSSTADTAAHGRRALCNGVLHGPQPGVGDDSPVILPVHHTSSYNSRSGCVLPAGRSSAPTGDQRGSYLGQQHAAAAAARRSLPFIVGTATGTGVQMLPGTNGYTPAAAAAHATDIDEAALTQPRSQGPIAPYSSPPLQQYNSAAAGLHSQQQQREAGMNLTQAQQSQQWVQLGKTLLIEPSANCRPVAAQRGNQPDQQQWAQLGEQLLGEPSADAFRQAPDIAPAATAASGSPRHMVMHQQQHVAAGDSRPGTGRSWSEQQQTIAAPDADCAPRLGSPVRPYKQQQQQQQTSGVIHDSNTCAVHEVTPVSPSVRAGVALSNLTLLQQLSTGQLQAAIDDVMSPTKSAQQQARQQQQQRSITAIQGVEATCGTARGMGEVTEDRMADATVRQVAGASSAVRFELAPSSVAQLQHSPSGQLQSAGDQVRSPTKAQQQQHGEGAGDQWGATDVQDSSSNMWPPHDASRDRQHYMEQHTPLCETASPAFGSSSATAGTGAFAGGSDSIATSPCMSQNNAGGYAAALAAATAAVQRMPPSPYGHSLGVQRYAADVAALSANRNSLECSVAVAGAWASTERSGLGACSPTAAAALASSPIACVAARQVAGWCGIQNHSHLGSPHRPLVHNYAAAGAAGVGAALRSGDSLQQQQLLRSSLNMSTAAVANTAAALDAAGEILNPYNAPGGIMSHQQALVQQQQQQPGAQLLAPAWQDAVAQALQGEVQQLKRQLAELQQQLRMAGTPGPEELALPPIEAADFPRPAAELATTAPASAVTAAGAHMAASRPPHTAAVQPATQSLLALPLPAVAVAEEPPAALDAGAASASTNAAQSLHSLQSEQQSDTPPSAVNSRTAVAAAMAPAGAADNYIASDGSSSTVAASSRAALETSGVVAIAASSSAAGSLDMLAHCQPLAIAASCAAGEGSPAARPQDDIAEEAGSPTASKFFAAHLPKPAAAAPSSCSTKYEMAAGTYHSAAAAAVLARRGAVSPRKATVHAPVAAHSPDRTGGESMPGAAAAAAHVSQHSSAGSLRGSGGHLRASLDVPPLAEVVRTKYCQLSDDSDDSDHEFEEKLMLKYGLKRQ